LKSSTKKRGYHDSCIRPYPFDQTQWIAETYIPGRTAKKTWKALRNPKSDNYQLFATPELAAVALESWVNRFEV
jgi:hypothetical protein